MVLEKLITYLTKKLYTFSPTKFRNQKKLYYNGQVIELPKNDPNWRTRMTHFQTDPKYIPPFNPFEVHTQMDK